MPNLLKPLRLATALCCLLLLAGSCKKKDGDAQPLPGHTGTLVFTSQGAVTKVERYAAATNTVTEVAPGQSAAVEGDLYVYYFSNPTQDLAKEGIIYSKTTDGTTLREVYHTGVALTYLSGLAVSPRGVYISYNDNSAGGVHGTVVMNTNTKVVNTIADYYDAAWMADGRLILAGTHDDRTYTEGLYLTDTGFGHLTRIDPSFTEPSEPALSPDGKTVACIQGSHLYTFSLDGSNPKQVTTGSYEETHPAFAPAGNYLACVAYGAFGDFTGTALAIIPAAPSAPVTLTDDLTNGIWALDKNGATNKGRLNPKDDKLSWY